MSRAAPPAGEPTLASAAWDLRGLTALPRLALRWRGLGAPRGDGQPVLVLPGFGTSDRSTAPLRAFLRRQGWAAHGWGQGVNTGKPDRHLGPLAARLEALAESGPVRLVGWSFGGVLARAIARRAPDRVERVLTLGSPVVGGPRHTFVAGNLRRRGEDLDALAARADAHEATPLPVPVVALYTRADGVVAWQACRDPHHAHVLHEEVGGTHVGLVYEPAVLARVAHWLQAPVPRPPLSPG